MLVRSFIHLPRVGPFRERRYWEDGVLCWNDLLADRDLFDDGPSPLLVEAVLQSRLKLAEGDARWFESHLGISNAWRMAADFDDGRVAYMDIETDGSRGNEIPIDDDQPGGTTVLSVWDGQRARVFLRGRDLDQIPAYLSQYKVLCTFNGKAFDLPYLEGRFGKGFFPGAHLDLRPITAAVGLTGGLKKIEKHVGITRPKMIENYTGYDAVKLWRAYCNGRQDALAPLALYNLADTVNLQALLRVVYNLYMTVEKLPFRRFEVLQEAHVPAALDEALYRLKENI